MNDRLDNAMMLVLYQIRLSMGQARMVDILRWSSGTVVRAISLRFGITVSEFGVAPSIKKSWNRTGELWRRQTSPNTIHQNSSTNKICLSIRNEILDKCMMCLTVSQSLNLAESGCLAQLSNKNRA